MWRIVDNTEDFKILFLSNYHFLLNLENLTFLDLGEGTLRNSEVLLIKIFSYVDWGGYSIQGRVLALHAEDFSSQHYTKVII